MPIPQSIKDMISKKDASVKTIDASNWGIDDNNVTDLVELLNTNLFIKKVNLSRNNIGEGAKLLGKLIYVNDINLSYNNVMDEQIEALAKSSIQRLDLSRNLITDKAGEILAEHSVQVYLKLDKTQISENVHSKIEAKIAFNSQLQLKSTLPQKTSNQNAKAIDSSMTVDNSCPTKRL